MTIPMTGSSMHRWLAAIGAGILAFAAPALAHHPIQAKFDETRQLSFTGRVTAIDWSNPHAHIFVRVDSDSPHAGDWAVELESPVVLQWGGWDADVLQIGEIVEIEGSAARDGSEQVWGQTIRRENGERVFALADDLFQTLPGDGASGPAPRWPDGRPRLGSATGPTGFWAVQNYSALVEDSVDVAMRDYGLLDDIADAAQVAPFQPWALKLYVARQQNFLKSDPLFQFCIPPGGPRMFQSPLGVKFVEQRERQRIFVLMGSGNGNWRVINMDGREQVGQISGNDNNPLFFGHSVATWNGDALEVDTRGFNEGFWFSNGGLPHTSMLHLEERFTRTDLNTLLYEVTVDDPGAYTRPWTSSLTLHWIADRDLPDYYCQDNRP